MGAVFPPGAAPSLLPFGGAMVCPACGIPTEIVVTCGTCGQTLGRCPQCSGTVIDRGTKPNPLPVHDCEVK